MLFQDIIKSYFRYKTVIQSKFRSTSEGQAFAYLLLGCILHFCGRIPWLYNQAQHLHSEIPIVGNLTANFFGTAILAPFLFYLLGAVSRLVLRLMGWKVSWLNARVSLFWAILITFPLSFLNGIVWAVTQSESIHFIFQIIILGAFLGFWFKALYIARKLYISD